MKELYSNDDLKIMRAAEDALLIGQNRVEELKLYAEKSGIKRIGIAHCIGMTREAEQLKEKLGDQFEVFTVDCKHKSIKSSELLNDPLLKGTSCNPAGQADYLAL